jgi:uncharacterized protein involved in response to NO
MRRRDTIPRWIMDRTLWGRRIHEPFVFAALGVALTAGFGYAALLAAMLAIKIPLGQWWTALVQAHGHAQLFGWLGLFVMGMGLYFLPRLGGAQLQLTGRAPYGFALLVVGIAARSLAQPALALADPSSAFAPAWRVLWIASALSELAGIALIASMLLATHRTEGRITRGSPEWHVLPFIVIALASLALAFVLNVLAVVLAARSPAATIDPGWDAIIIRLMLYGLAVPMAIVFSVRNLPLVMRLAAPPQEGLRTLAYVYAAALALGFLPQVQALSGVTSFLLDRAGDLGGVLHGLVILIFIWRLDLLRRHAPWTAQRAPNTRPDLEYLRKPTRDAYPDAGEYGRFELLIYSAYSWLAATALFEIVRGGAALFGTGSPIPADAERHALTVGFITLLIFGMAARLLPGFSHKRRLAYPALVLVTFLLGNLAALLRVVPLFFPSSDLALALLGSSGAIGWLAVGCLAINIVRTVRT